ncbi:MAG TPA: hypothetical protein PLE57_09765, partial [Methanoregulaceae archaeon]|nr:hypothetical protein [Methanoregulaceae archaeon]
LIPSITKLKSMTGRLYNSHHQQKVFLGEFRIYFQELILPAAVSGFPAERERGNLFVEELFFSTLLMKSLHNPSDHEARNRADFRR